MVKIGAPRLRRLMRAPNHKTLIKTFTAVIRTDDLQRVCFFARLARSAQQPAFGQPVTLDDHSKVVPRLPIPNRIVKRLSADDSWHSPVKVGHRQALTPQSPCIRTMQGLCSWRRPARGARRGNPADWARPGGLRRNVQSPTSPAI